MKEIKGKFLGKGKKILIVVSPMNQDFNRSPDVIELALFAIDLDEAPTGSLRGSTLAHHVSSRRERRDFVAEYRNS